MWPVVHRTVDEAYQAVLTKLVYGPYVGVGPRGLRTNEVIDAIIQITEPSSKPVETANVKRNERIARYTAAEFDLFERGVNDVNEFAKHAEFWRTVGDPDGTVNSSYGRIIWYDRTIGTSDLITPWEWCKAALLKDRDARQATLLFMRPDHLRETKDLICTCHGQFMIRGGELNLTVVMRSNDVVKGFVYDVPWFCHVLARMAHEIKIRVGTYTHIAHSLHLYTCDLEVARSMIHEGPTS